MKKLILSGLSCIVIFLSGISALYAQSSTMDDVYLFQSFFRDAPISTTPYGEGLIQYSDYDFFNSFTVGAQGGFAITPEFELNTGLYFLNIDPEGAGDGESGIVDIPIYGRYNFVNEQQTKASGGAYLTLPVGSEDIGQGNTHFGLFGALRHALSNQTVLTGTLGLDFLEAGNDDREVSLVLGGGIIYAAKEELNIIGELSIQTETDHSALSGGVDYEVSDVGRIRGNLLIGLDDGAPDIGLTAGFLMFFQ